MDKTLQLLIEELKTVTYNSRPNIKYQDQMDLIERLENELKKYILDIPKLSPTPPENIDIIADLAMEESLEPNHITYPVENPVVIPKQKGRKPKSSQ